MVESEVLSGCRGSNFSAEIEQFQGRAVKGKEIWRNRVGGLWCRLRLESKTSFLSNLRAVWWWTLNASQSPKTREVSGNQDVRWSHCFEPPQTHFPLPPRSILFCWLWKAQSLSEPSGAGLAWRQEACCCLGGPHPILFLVLRLLSASLQLCEDSLW